jgi:hypothetical protein
VDGVFECYTLEDEERLVKIKGKTAINCGFYKVIINHSNHFGKNLPLLLDVPNFEGVRIHPGNTAADTEGCILVGRALKKDVLTESRAAFSPLFVKMTIALSEREPINIIIE